jgi:putative CocE/NonD family hydrolase
MAMRARTVDVRGPDAVTVPMSDGVNLAADLYLPDVTPPFATLVRKTPYARRARPEVDLYLASHGYAVLVVNQRGRFDSEGTFYQMRNESVDHNDGYDTIEWAAAQPWSTGRVGTYGISSDGQWQLAAATTRPPHLRAMFVSYAADARVARIEGGTFLGTGPAWASMNGLSRPLASRDDWLGWLADWQRTAVPLVASFIEPEFLDAFFHVDYDGYWRETDPSNRLDQVEVPVFHEGGWFDRYVTTTFRNFSRIRNGADRGASDAQRVVMGPWMHGGGVPEDAGPVRFGQAAHIDRLDLHRRWFDHWLRDTGDGIDDIPRVQVYLMGSERWVRLDTWPPPGATTTRWYLRRGPSGSASSLNDGVLDLEEPSHEPADTYLHDPFDPVPSIGGHGGVGWQWPAGPIDQRPAELRSLTYTTPPLERDVTVLGEPILEFWATTSAADTDFVLTLSDVYPDGHSAILRQNAVRAEYRRGEAHAEPITPGTVEPYRVVMGAIGNVFKRGHRVRLRISSSSFPAFLPNPGIGGPLALATRAVRAENAILHDPDHPSSLELPLVE